MRVRTRTVQRDDELRYLPEVVVAGVVAERADVEKRLGHTVCGRYLGGPEDRPNVCWKSPGHGDGHL